MIRQLFAAVISMAVLLPVSCSRGDRALYNETPLDILESMRRDTSWISTLDSLSQIAIGPGAKCIDPVKHTFSFAGGTFLFNQDWGGVLQIPSDYVVEDDLWQAEISFHGTRAFSPDSMIVVSFYCGLDGLLGRQSYEEIAGILEEDGFTIEQYDEYDDSAVVQARSSDGIIYYLRSIHGNKGGVEYRVSVQYPSDRSEEGLRLIDMSGKFPAGPEGNLFEGMAL